MRIARLAAVLGVLAGGMAVAVVAAPQAVGQRSGAVGQRPGPASAGRALYADACASCHGTDGRGGVRGRGPSLIGVGAASVDFSLSTGRMPLSRPGIQPERAGPIYSRRQIAQLTAYVTGLGVGGPPVPEVDPARGDVADGRRLFTDSCSGCHQIQTEGGVAPGLVAPPLSAATPTQIGEAVRVGPYLMPKFGERQLSKTEVDSIARFVTGPGRDPVDRGGWGIGNIGPITEGLVAFLLLGSALVITARVIGERTG
ncbi:MAG: c-type cytochrome [Thermoleophilaceae bacterium]